MNDKGMRGYQAVYANFDSPEARRLRAEAYGEDVGQHSWATGEELREHIAALAVTGESRFLDLGCGAGGPLTYIVARTGCRAVGLDASAAGIAAARFRVREFGQEGRVEVAEADLDQALPLPASSQDAVLCLDVVLHLGDRAAFFREVARVLSPGGRFLLTDAGVLTGAVSSDEIESRSLHGPTHFAPPSFNPEALKARGLVLRREEDLTAALIRSATARLNARRAHSADLIAREGSASYERQEVYLETVIRLAGRGALSRRMYLADAPRSLQE